MCTSPLHLNRKPISGFSYDVPCGNCLECRSTLQDAWVFRLTKDLKAVYDAGGLAVFLTFSYNDAYLPHSDFGFANAVTPCFNNSQVLGFLNKLKVYMHRTYGKCSYKYFVCEEYGKHTRRPHLHGIFMLNRAASCNWPAFVEKARQYWFYGFTFPRCINGNYVDNHGKRTSPCLRDYNKCGCYASKYITKDLDFYALPTIKRYADLRPHLPREVRKTFDNGLPKHFQSKGLGSSFDIMVNTPSKMMNALTYGVPNYKLRYVQLPRYYVLKHCFKNEVVDGVVKSVIRPEYRECVRYVYYNTLHSKVLQFDKFFHSLHLQGLSPSILSFLSAVRSKYNAEQIVCMNFIYNLSDVYKAVFKSVCNDFNCFNLANFRVNFINGVYHDFEISQSTSEDKLLESAHSIYKLVSSFLNRQRNDDCIKRYREFLINRKLKYLSYA